MCRTCGPRFSQSPSPPATKLNPKPRQSLTSDWINLPITSEGSASQAGLQTTSIYISLVMHMYMYRHMYMYIHVYTHIPRSVLTSQTLRLSLQSYCRLIERNASLIF